MRKWIFAGALWLVFIGAAGGRLLYVTGDSRAISQALGAMFTQDQATDMISIPRMAGHRIVGYEMAKARFTVASAIRDPESTPIKPLIIDAMHAYFLEGHGDPEDLAGLIGFVRAAVDGSLGEDVLGDLAITLRRSAVSR